MNRVLSYVSLDVAELTQHYIYLVSSRRSIRVWPGAGAFRNLWVVKPLTNQGLVIGFDNHHIPFFPQHSVRLRLKWREVMPFG